MGQLNHPAPGLTGQWYKCPIARSSRRLRLSLSAPSRWSFFLSSAAAFSLVVGQIAPSFCLPRTHHFPGFGPIILAPGSPSHGWSNHRPQVRAMFFSPGPIESPGLGLDSILFVLSGLCFGERTHRADHGGACLLSPSRPIPAFLPCCIPVAPASVSVSVSASLLLDPRCLPTNHVAFAVCLAVVRSSRWPRWDAHGSAGSY